MKLKFCVVPECFSTSLKEPHLAYHKFPACPDTRRTWTERMKVVAENLRHPTPQVCSKHFRKDDYLPFHKTSKRMLKKGAAPSIFPWGICETPTYLPAVSQVPLKRKKKRKFIPRPVMLNTTPDRDATISTVDLEGLEGSIADISTENSTDVTKRSEESKDSEGFSSKNIIESENSDHGSVTDTSSVSFTPEKSKHQKHGHGKYALGVRLEAKDVSSNKWYKAKVVEVDWEDAEVLIHFEQWSQRFDEWIPMDSPRLRPWQNHSPRSSQSAFRVGETVMASWTDNRKYAARIKSILNGDKYEVQFFDGFVKTVKGHKISKGSEEILAMDPGLFHNAGATTMTKAERRERKRKIGPVSELFQFKKKYAFDPDKSVSKKLSFDTSADDSKEEAITPKVSSVLADRKRDSDGKSRHRAFPVIKVTLDSDKPKTTPDKKGKTGTNLRDTSVSAAKEGVLPSIPHRALKRRKRDDIDPSDYNNWEPEGEEAWVVESSEGLRRSIVVKDDRLPAGWNKHSIQRKSGNSAGKWDVFLVSPTGRRFRSRKEMATYFAERAETYQPELFDFTLRCKMRRKNKDTEHMKEKIKKPGSKRHSKTLPTKPAETPVEKDAGEETSTPPSRRVKTLLPRSLEERGTVACPPPPHPSTQGATELTLQSDDKVAIGNLKIQMENDAYVCPKEGCLKHFRKENLLQMHIKHYHPEYSKFMGSTPNVADLAYARTVGEPLDDCAPKSRPFNATFFEQINRFEAQKKTKLLQVKRAASPAPESAASEKAEAAAPEENETKPEAQKATLPLDVEAKTQKRLEELPMEDILEGKAIDLEEYIKPMACSSATPPLPKEFPSTKEGSSTSVAGIKTLLPVVRTTVKIPPLEMPEEVGQSAPAVASAHSPSADLAASRADLLMPLQKSRIVRKRRLSDMYIETLKKRKLGKLTKCLDDTAIDSRDDQSPLRFPSQQPKYRYLKKKKMSSPLPQLQLLQQNQPDSPMDTSEPDCSPGSATLALTEEENFEQLQKKDIINCTCGIMEEDGLMIQCDLCLCWQHVLCNSNMEEVPDKYVCYICLHPARERKSRHFVHDQYWLKEGTLPSLAFRTKDAAAIAGREERLMKSHDLTGSLLGLKEVVHSLRVKLAIAEQPDHPKLYLWAEKTAGNLSATGESAPECGDSDLKRGTDRGVTDAAPEVKLEEGLAKEDSGAEGAEPSGPVKREEEDDDDAHRGSTECAPISGTPAVRDHTYVHLESTEEKVGEREAPSEEDLVKSMGDPEPQEKSLPQPTEGLKLDPDILADAFTSSVLPEAGFVPGSTPDLDTVLNAGLSSGSTADLHTVLDAGLSSGSTTDLHTVLDAGLNPTEHPDVNPNPSADLIDGLGENPALCPVASAALNADLGPGLNIGNPLDAAAQNQLLQFPICQSELMRFASSMADNLKETANEPQPAPSVSQAPQPEKPIDPIECRLNLLDHIEDFQDKIGNRLSDIDQQISVLESEDPEPLSEETADFYPQTKHTIQMLIRDLATMKKLAVAATGYTLIKQ